MFTDQSVFDIRCEWGSQGLLAVGDGCAAIIIVDVLSFTTCVEIAVSRGARVFPYRWKDQTAADYAVAMNAELAGPRRKGAKFSLSPESMLNAVAGGRIVLPSPNGSALTLEAAGMCPCVLAGCFRNFSAVASTAAAQGRTVAVIPAGERWADGSLRPSLEDLAAAGAVIAHLQGSRSPDAEVAVAAWATVQDRLPAVLRACASGRQLLESGFARDVQLAGEADVSDSVPLLQDHAYFGTVLPRSSYAVGTA
ncbi:MAG: 2-phosphosulfolactate phosphatase [Phycisphaerae bacterium]